MTAFDPGNLDTQARGLANLMPNSREWVAKNIPNTNIAKLIRAMSNSIFTLEKTIQDIAQNNDIRYTVDLISQWESVFGIPNDSFTNQVSLVQRRIQVLAMLWAQGCTTVCDFINLIEKVFGNTNISIVHGSDFIQYPPYNVPFTPHTETGNERWTWYIYGDNMVPKKYPPYNVPFTPNGNSTPMTRFVQKLKPENTILIFRNNPLPPGITGDTC